MEFEWEWNGFRLDFNLFCVDIDFGVVVAVVAVVVGGLGSR